MRKANPSIWTYWMQTFGCKVNQYESQALREHWLELGAHEQRTPELADIIFIHSCAVTAEAVADARQAIRKALRTTDYGRILVTGCAAQIAYEELLAEGAGSGRLYVVPNETKAGLLEMHPLSDALADLSAAPHGFASKRCYPPFYIMDFWRSRPVLKVQDGCSHHCTYCIVPLSRGSAVSRPVQDVLTEARLLLHAGFRELIISGINLAHYGRDLQDCDFWTMLMALEASLAPEWAGRARLRISSLEPTQLDARGLDVLAQSQMVCPHIHLSLQSGSSTVLKRMGRGHYHPQELEEQIAALQRIWPVLGLGADFLTGFVGESEEEFQETLDFVQAQPFNYAHVFPYSERPGTAAASMPQQIDVRLRHERAAQLRRVLRQKKQNFLEQLCQQERLMLAVDLCKDNFWESHQSEQPDLSSRPVQSPAFMRGVCEYYAPCRMSSEDYGRLATMAEKTSPASAAQATMEALWGKAADSRLAEQGSQGKAANPFCVSPERPMPWAAPHETARHDLVAVKPLRVVDDTLLVTPV